MATQSLNCEQVERKCSSNPAFACLTSHASVFLTHGDDHHISYTHTHALQVEQDPSSLVVIRRMNAVLYILSFQFNFLNIFCTE